MAPFARERSPSPPSGPGERGVASSTTSAASGVPAAVELGANRSCAVAFASGTTHFDRGRAARRPRPRRETAGARRRGPSPPRFGAAEHRRRARRRARRSARGTAIVPRAGKSHRASTPCARRWRHFHRAAESDAALGAISADFAAARRRVVDRCTCRKNRARCANAFSRRSRTVEGATGRRAPRAPRACVAFARFSAKNYVARG